MSDIYGVKPYARTILLGLGYKEHKTLFSDEDLPNAIVDKAFFLTQNPVTGVSNNQDFQQMTVPLQVRVYKKTFRRESEKFQEAMTAAEVIRDAFLAPRTRLTQPKIKNVSFATLDVVPVAGDNPHAMIVNLTFNFMVIVSTRGNG